jgi:hypothetical protein
LAGRRGDRPAPTRRPAGRWRRRSCRVVHGGLVGAGHRRTPGLFAVDHLPAARRRGCGPSNHRAQRQPTRAHRGAGGWHVRTRDRCQARGECVLRVPSPRPPTADDQYAGHSRAPQALAPQAADVLPAANMSVSGNAQRRSTSRTSRSRWQSGLIDAGSQDLGGGEGARIGRPCAQRVGGLNPPLVEPSSVVGETKYLSGGRGSQASCGWVMFRSAMTAAWSLPAARQSS